MKIKHLENELNEAKSKIKTLIDNQKEQAKKVLVVDPIVFFRIKQDTAENLTMIRKLLSTNKELRETINNKTEEIGRLKKQIELLTKENTRLKNRPESDNIPSLVKNRQTVCMNIVSETHESENMLKGILELRKKNRELEDKLNNLIVNNNQLHLPEIHNSRNNGGILQIILVGLNRLKFSKNQLKTQIKKKTHKKSHLEYRRPDDSSDNLYNL